jgi:hypothetical protein
MKTLEMRLRNVIASDDDQLRGAIKTGRPCPKREQAASDSARSGGLREWPDVRGVLDMPDRAELARDGTA